MPRADGLRPPHRFEADTCSKGHSTRSAPVQMELEWALTAKLSGFMV